MKTQLLRIKSLTAGALLLCPAMCSFAATTNVVYGGTNGFAFNPVVVNIKQGDVVIWTDAGTIHNHTVTGPPSDPLCGGGFVTSCSWTFTNAGSFAYKCNTHLGMTGLVVVASAPVVVNPAVLTNMTVLPNGHAQFQVFSTAQFTNRVQASTNLAVSNWTTISTVVPTTNTFIVTDSNAPGFQLRFYRVVQP